MPWWFSLSVFLAQLPGGPDFESSLGTETVRVRIAGWSSARQTPPNEEETRPEKDKDRL